MNNIQKLCSYCLDCVKATRSTAFNNLKSSKDNKIIITSANEFAADNKDIIDIMTKQALNKSTMGIFKGMYIIEGIKNKNKYYAPLLYADAELIRNGDKITLDYDMDGFMLNVGLIASLLDNNEEKIENIISQLLEIENPEKIDFEKVLNGLINLDGMTIKKDEAIILSKTPESVAGLINELKLIKG